MPERGPSDATQLRCGFAAFSHLRSCLLVSDRRPGLRFANRAPTALILLGLALFLGRLRRLLDLERQRHGISAVLLLHNEALVVVCARHGLAGRAVMDGIKLIFRAIGRIGPDQVTA